LHLKRLDFALALRKLQLVIFIRRATIKFIIFQMLVSFRHRTFTQREPKLVLGLRVIVVELLF